MSRREFSKKIKRAAFARADGHCEACGANLSGKPVHYDHELADNLGGEPTLENARVLCVPCHTEKTAQHDVPLIAKGRRIRERNMGIKRTSRPLPGTRASGIRKRMNGNVERWSDA